ncbi:hypothetical protein BU15DRAFT_73482 [Melanogaster broomeanus]|nr:hypothetical protein BU15DRAFT_73482 [Melanogaster broomeanus]
MRPSLFFAFLALPALSIAQSKQISTTSQASVITNSPSASPSGTASGNATVSSISGSASISGGSSGNATSTTTPASPLPTAATSVPGVDGDGPNGGAPSPGASADGGIYGPPDGYIAAAEALRSVGMLGVVGVAVGGALVLV